MMSGAISNASASCTANTTGSGILFNTFMAFLPGLRDDVDHVRLAPLDRIHPSLECGSQQLRIGDRSRLTLHAVAFRHLAVVDIGISQGISNVAAIGSATAHAGHVFH